MTRILYEPEDFHLRIEGHAGAGQAGEDLVCAAASILGWTLVSAAEPFSLHLQINELEGLMDVSCRPDAEDEERCRFLFDALAGGYAMLAERYPEHITMEGFTDG